MCISNGFANGVPSIIIGLRLKRINLNSDNVMLFIDVFVLMECRGTYFIKCVTFSLWRRDVVMTLLFNARTLTRTHAHTNSLPTFI